MVRAFGFASIRIAVAFILVGLAVLASPGSRGAVRAQDGASVAIFDFGFDSASITVEVGTTVTWTNTGGVAHTVTADGGGFDSGNIGAGGTYSFTFDTPGTYSYFCAIHPSMTGEVIVVEAGDDDTGDADTGDDDADTGDDDAATGDDDTDLPSTGVGTTAMTHGAPYALLALAIILAASGFLVTRRHPTR
jgi:plastocyanin